MKNNIINFFKRIANSEMEFVHQKKIRNTTIILLLYFSFISVGLWVQNFDTTKLIMLFVIVFSIIIFTVFQFIARKKMFYYYVSYFAAVEFFDMLFLLTVYTFSPSHILEKYLFSRYAAILIIFMIVFFAAIPISKNKEEKKKKPRVQYTVPAGAIFLTAILISQIIDRHWFSKASKAELVLMFYIIMILTAVGKYFLLIKFFCKLHFSDKPDTKN